MNTREHYEDHLSPDIELEPGKLYRVLMDFVAERGHTDEDGEDWTDLVGVDPGEIFLYLGFYPPDYPTFKTKGLHHFLMSNGTILRSTFAFSLHNQRSKGRFVEEIKTT